MEQYVAFPGNLFRQEFLTNIYPFVIVESPQTFRFFVYLFSVRL